MCRRECVAAGSEYHDAKVSFGVWELFSFDGDTSKVSYKYR